MSFTGSLSAGRGSTGNRCITWHPTDLPFDLELYFLQRRQNCILCHFSTVESHQWWKSFSSGDEESFSRTVNNKTADVLITEAARVSAARILTNLSRNILVSVSGDLKQNGAKYFCHYFFSRPLYLHSFTEPNNFDWCTHLARCKSQSDVGGTDEKYGTRFELQHWTANTISKKRSINHCQHNFGVANQNWI